MVAKQSAFLDGTNGPSQECPTVAAQSRSFSEKSCRGRVDAEGGCSRLQRQPQNRRQVGGPPPTGSHGAVAGPLFTPTAKSQDDFRLVASSGHRAAAPVASWLSDRAFDRALFGDRQPHPAEGALEPLARSASAAAGSALRASSSRRSAAPGHQGTTAVSGLDARRRPTPWSDATSRTQGAARRHRRSLVHRLLAVAARPESRDHDGLPARCCRLYAERGIIVRALLTDNGSSYRSH